MRHSHSFAHSGNVVQVFTSRLRQHHQLKDGAPVAIHSRLPGTSTKSKRQIKFSLSPLDAPSVDESIFIKAGRNIELDQPITKTNLDEIFEPQLDEIHQLFDDSKYADCGFIAMAEHTAEMTTLDRIISEDCYCPRNGGKVTHPRMVLSDGLTKYYRAEYISKRLQCNSGTAERFISDWRRLSLTSDIIETVIKGIQRKHSLASASLYFTRLASQMPDSDLLNHYDTMDRLQGSIAESDDETDEEFIALQEELESSPVPDGYSFIPVGETGEKIAPDVLTWKYRRLIEELHGSYSYIKTKALCSKTIKDKKISNFETTMFLNEYRRHLDSVTKFWLKSDKVFSKIYNKVLKTDAKNLPKVGNWLAKLAVGKVAVPGYVPNDTFTKMLKDLYFSRKDPKPVKVSPFELPLESFSPKSRPAKVDLSIPSAFQLDLPEPEHREGNVWCRGPWP